MKQEVKQARNAYKEALKNKVIYKERRDNLVELMLKTCIPNWGSIKIKLIEIGTL